MLHATSAVLETPGRLVLTERELRPGPAEVIVEVAAAGVCGTDLAIFDGHYVVPLPLVLGHEFSGVVEPVASEQFEYLVGKRVVAEINNTCASYGRELKCPACAKCLSNHCIERTVLGIVRAHGAFSTHVVIPALNVHEIPDGLSFEEAVFVEPLAAAIQIFEQCPISSKDTVVVLGAGRLGTLVCAVAAGLGACVIVVSRSQSSLARASAMGTCECVLAGPGAAGEIRALTGGLGADVVVEATGDPDGLAAAFEMVRPRGRVAAKTTCGLAPASFDLTRLVVDEISLVGSRCGPFDDAIAALAGGSIRVAHLIEATFALRELEQAIAAARRKAKVVVRP